MARGLRIGHDFVAHWARNLTSAVWVEVPVASTLSDIDPIDDVAINPNYPLTPEWAENDLRFQAVVTAWCGATYDTARDVMWLGMGGGHRDYAGNEILKCGFNVSAPAWEMVRPPSGAVGNLLTTDDGQEATGLYSDGRPRAVHTYGKWVYIDGVGPILAVHGSTSWSAAGGKQWPVIINESDGEHTFGTDDSTQNLGDVSAGGACVGADGVIYYQRKNTRVLRKYTPAAGPDYSAGTWSTVGTAEYVGTGVSIAYLPDDDCVLVCKQTGGFAVIDCSTGTRYAPTFSGTVSGGALAYQTQPMWVASLGAVCFWDNTTDRTLITTLTPGADPRTDTWTIGSLPVSGSNAVTPSARASNGTFGRFAYAPNLGGFLLFNDIAGPTYFYKI